MRSRAGLQRALPTEFEWEAAAEGLPATGNTLAHARLAAAPCRRARPAAGRARCSATSGNGRRAPIFPIPAIARPGRARRVQRQVHGEPAGPARGVVRDAAKATRGRPIATSSIPTSAGSSPACALPRRPSDAHDHECPAPARPRAPPRERARARRDRRPVAPEEEPPLPLLLRRARQRAVRGDHAPSRVLSDPRRDRHPRGQCARDRAGRRRREHRRRVRIGIEPQDSRSCCATCRRAAPT